VTLFNNTDIALARTMLFFDYNVVLQFISSQLNEDSLSEVGSADAEVMTPKLEISVCER